MARIDWLEIWVQDIESIIYTMKRNLQADLDCGYNPEGDCVKRQQAEITLKELDYNDTMKRFRFMTEKEINHFCRIDLRRRGAIA